SFSGQVRARRSEDEGDESGWAQRSQG
ncbi:MAG: hypothetical protein RLZ08_717, partial [Pseudomonadota bacterium]